MLEDDPRGQGPHPLHRAGVALLLQAEVLRQALLLGLQRRPPLAQRDDLRLARPAGGRGALVPPRGGRRNSLDNKLGKARKYFFLNNAIFF